jgi:hypothetical protein
MKRLKAAILVAAGLMAGGAGGYYAGWQGNERLEWSFYPATQGVAASGMDTAELLAISDDIYRGFMRLNGCSGVSPVALTVGPCVDVIGNWAGGNARWLDHDVFLGNGAGVGLGDVSYRVVVANMFDCDIKARRCWYLGGWRIEGAPA